MMFISDAIVSLVPKAKFSIEDEDYNKIVWNDERSLPSESEVIAEANRLAIQYENNQYQRDRATAYPSIAEQLDLLYHDIKSGALDSGAWIAAIEAVKTQYPKP